MSVRGRGGWLVGALVLGAVAAVLFMRPVIVAPVAGDDREWFPKVAAVEPWSVTGELERVPEWWEVRTGKGRVNVLTDLERRAAGRLVVETSVDSGAPTYLVNGALKLLLAGLAVLTLTALLRTLRCRRRDGALVRLSGRTVALATLAGGVLFAVGSQPPFHVVNGRNAWVNYPTHSFGAVLSILGVTALVLWLTRLYAEGRFRVPVVLLLVSLAVATNFRYELVLPAGPLVLVALLLVPVTPADRAAEGRRAKWVTGLSFVGVFAAVLVALRVFLRGICADGGCYDAVTPRLSWGIAGTFWQNVVGSVPGTTADRVAEYVEGWGISSEGMYVPTPWSLAVGAGMAVALLVAWWATRPTGTPDAVGTERAAADDGVARGVDEGRLLGLAALLCLLGALGAAGMMSLSVQVQTHVDLGVPYRHTVVTWAGLAWALGLGVLALRHRSPRAGVATWVALSVAVGLAAAFLLPSNERSLAADRVENRATTAAFAALVRGDLSDEANAHRCRLVPAILEERDDDAVREFGKAFRRYWGQAFCQRG